MSYEIGQIFEEIYPPAAAQWCNENNAYIDEIQPLKNIRRFEIKAVPEPSEEEKKQAKIEELKAKLNEIDLKKIRSVSAIAAGTATEDDKAYLQELEIKAQELREELKEIG